MGALGSLRVVRRYVPGDAPEISQEKFNGMYKFFPSCLELFLGRGSYRIMRAYGPYGLCCR